tara:strand:- start:169 stop:2145 length:1977 start_codon:yes stop_codon:yes gene_type:complete
MMVKLFKNNDSFIIKSFFFITLIAILKIPLNELSDLLFLLLGIFFITSFNLKNNANFKNSYFYLIILIILLISFLTKKNNIIEFNSTFFSKADIKTISQLLPDKIIQNINIDHSKLEIDRILKSHDSSEYNDKESFNSYKFIEKPYSFSTENYFNSNKYTRNTNKIYFNNREKLRINQINTLRYNLTYDKELRREIPFYVMYIIPNDYLKSKICGEGNIFYAFSDKDKKNINKINFTKKENNKCINFNKNKNLYLIGYSINKKDNLEIKLHKNNLNFSKDILYFFIIFIYFLIFIKKYFILKKFSRKELTVFFITIFSALFFFLLKDPNIITGLRYFRGGADGLVHENHAIMIIQNLYQLNIFEALKGSEDVFYFMPGLRYFLAVSKLIFGDTSYGYVIISIILPISLFYLFKNLISEKISFYLILLFTVFPIFENMGFGYFNYIHQIIRNHAETLSISIIVFCLAKFSEKNFIDKINFTKSFIYCFILSLSLFCRPNFFPTIFILIFFIFFSNYKKNIFAIIGASLGSTFVFSSLLHNIYFANEWTFFTSSTIHFAYNESFQNLNFLNLNNSVIYNQLSKWNPLYNIHRLLILIFVIYCFFKYKKSIFVFLILTSTIMQHLVLLLTHPDSRYAYLAWLLTFILFVYYLFNIYFKKLK